MAAPRPPTPIARQLATLADTDMRLARIADFVRDGDAAQVVISLERAAHGVHQGDERLLHAAVVHLLCHVRPRPDFPGGPITRVPDKHLLGAVRAAELIAMARRLHARYVAVLLREAFTMPSALDSIVLKPHVTIEHLPLGTRRERARMAPPSVHRPLLIDTTPVVVQILAENPRLGEAQALQLAARRPTQQFALVAVLMTWRWLVRDRVREAVALNPSCPVWLALALAPLLTAQSLQQMVRNRDLDTELLMAMQGLLGGAVDDTLRRVASRGSAPAETPVFEVGLDEMELDPDVVIAAALVAGVQDGQQIADLEPDQAAAHADGRTDGRADDQA